MKESRNGKNQINCNRMKNTFDELISRLDVPKERKKNLIEKKLPQWKSKEKKKN